jgi:hypothetical protein
VKTLADQRHLQLLAYARASTEGTEAARDDKGLDANPYAEESECHWRWLNAWCNEKTKNLTRRP